MNNEFFTNYNEIIVPSGFLFLAVLLRIISVVRDSPEARREMRSHFFLTGVELCILSLSVYLLGSFIVDNFYGFVFQESYDHNIVFIAIFMTIFLVFLLALSIICFRCSNPNSWIMNQISSTIRRRILRFFFVLFSFVIGVLSMKLLVDIVIKSI